MWRRGWARRKVGTSRGGRGESFKGEEKEKEQRGRAGGERKLPDARKREMGPLRDVITHFSYVFYVSMLLQPFLLRNKII